MYFMGCFPFGSGPSHPEPHCWNKFIENSEFSRERSSLDPPTPRNFLTFLNFNYSVNNYLFISNGMKSNAAPKCISLKTSYARA